MKNTLTIREAAYELGCGRDWIRKEARRGAFKIFRINARVVHIDAVSFREYAAKINTQVAQLLQVR